MKDQTRYAVDGSNRLIIERRRKALPVEGRFSLGADNRLIYLLNEPAPWRRQHSLPGKIVFDGSWQLNKNYDLELHLEQDRRLSRECCLVLKGEIISVDADALVFELKSFDKEGLLHVQLLKITGSWNADEYNRLSFTVKKKTQPDTLTLEGIWQVNKNQQITYACEKTSLKTKTRIINTLTFEGFWKIDKINRLTYILSRGANSRFDFRVQLESPNLYPREGAIKFRLGIGLKKEGPQQGKTVSLYGAWKFSRKLGLVFQMDYGRGKLNNIEFGTNVCLSKRDEISLYLTNKRKEPLGINITFTRRFLRNHGAGAFLRFKKSKREAGIEAGLSIPF